MSPTIAFHPPLPPAPDDAHSLPIPMAVPAGSGSSSRSVPTSSSSLSTSHRHHPYSASPSSYTSSSSRNRPHSANGPRGRSEGDSDEIAGAMELELVPEAGGKPTTVAPPPTPPVPKPKTSHARKTPPGHIKRPPNAFILFRSHCCAPASTPDTIDPPGTPSAQQLSELGITDHRHISRIVSHLWKSLTSTEKSFWEKKAQEKKAEHMRLHPDYRYRPVFRAKDAVRRRRKGDEDEMEEEKRGCEEVARALLEPGTFDRQRTPEPARTEEEASPNRARWKVDVARDTLPTGSGPAPPPALASKRKRAPRPKTARGNSPSPGPSTAPLPATELSSSYAYDRRMADARDAYDRPHTAPVGAFPLQYSYGRPASRNVNYHNDASQFSYMTMLDNGEDDRHGGVDPRDFGGPRPKSAYAHPHASSHVYSSGQPSFEADSRRAPPPPLPYNPTFFYSATYDGDHQHPGQQSQHGSPNHPPAGPPPPPLSPRSLAVSQFQNYDIQAGHVPSRAARSSSALHLPSSDRLREPSPGFSARRDSDVPNLASMGMKRRGTLGRTQEGGDLMLISPTTGTFGGRRFSLGKWEVRRDSGETVRGDPESGVEGGKAPHPLSAEVIEDAGAGVEDVTMEAFEFDQNFLNTVMLNGGREEHSRPGSAGGYASSSGYSEQQRPGTAVSDFSTDGSLDDRDRGTGGGGQYWRRAASEDAKRQPPPAFHVGPQDYFLVPEPAVVPTSRERFDPAAPTQYASSPFINGGNSYSPYVSGHRQSIDALLATSASYPAPHFSSFNQLDSPASNQQQQQQHVVDPDFDEEAWMASRGRPRGSEATLREAPARRNPTREAAMAVLDQQQQSPRMARPEGSAEGFDDTQQYIYLTREQAGDPALVDQILKSGFGVTYDHDEEDFQPVADSNARTGDYTA